ncbi:MAG: hypothetical protein Ct9H300mP28_27130 [Pseudomonadota bacterium]|nr:MAG: hypothetical protein Ct9H300mP28_27130 [Pseudomonadota bacterium]
MKCGVKIPGLEKEAEQMVKNCQKDAEIEKERIIEEGKKEIERMKRQASFALEQERRKAEANFGTGLPKKGCISRKRNETGNESKPAK